jgi:hypothetical protein
MKKVYILIFLISISILSCKKAKNLPLIDGTYTGTFKVIYTSGTQTGITKITFGEGIYSCLGNGNFIPAGGSGIYIQEENKITFKDSNFWTANFDWNLILSGSYDYSFNGENLKIYIKRSSNIYYEYNLVKQ